MSLSSGGPGPFNRDSYEHTLAELRRTLSTVPVAGMPTRTAEAGELAELDRLVHKYPEQARQLLDKYDKPDTER